MIDKIGTPRNPAMPDGRQSERAREIARGTMRLLNSLALAGLCELTLPNGRRADIMALGDKHAIWIIEIKASLSDFQTDHKWQDYLEHCDQFYFAVGPEFPREVLPETTGLIIADRFGGQIERPAPQHALSAARRKTLTLRFARMAASRLGAILDPDAALEPR